jgi:hypothetical protein
MNKRLLVIGISISAVLLVGVFAGYAAAGAGQGGPNDPGGPMDPPVRATRTDATATSQVQAAVVQADGTFVRGSSGASSHKVSGFTGAYNVIFPRAVWGCVYSATLGQIGHAGVAAAGSITVAGDKSNDHGVFVQTRNGDGTKALRDFHLIVACPE